LAFAAVDALAERMPRTGAVKLIEVVVLDADGLRVPRPGRR